MAKKITGLGNGLVYSTNKEAMQPEPDATPLITLSPEKQRLRIRTDSKQRAGKLVTLVEFFEGNDDDMEALGKMLKTKCGTGGSVKDGIIIVQGDYKEKIIALLRAAGYVGTK